MFLGRGWCRISSDGRDSCRSRRTSTKKVFNDGALAICAFELLLELLTRIWSMRESVGRRWCNTLILVISRPNFFIFGATW